LLPFEIRAIGERFRQIGRAVFNGNALSLDEQNRYRKQVGEKLAKQGAKPVLELRAVQTELFVSALHAYEQTGEVSLDLQELGGEFLELATRLGWVKSGPSRAHRQLLLDTDERRALFLLRWTELAGLTDTADFRLAPSWILLGARTRLRAPLAKLGRSELEVVERVVAVDPGYPGSVAKGLLYAQLGAYDAAAEQFREYLTLHPNASFSTHAKNHLLFVNQIVAEQER
jgi:hypothetical protein